MSTSVTGKKQCVTCSKSGGIMTCDGCQQSFCGKHSIEHRQALANQLDGIMQEHDLLLQELNRPLDKHSLIQEINKWEKESITKIQVTAEAARADLQEILDRSKKITSKACHDIAINLRSSREADDFSENDLNRWMEELKQLKLKITSPSSIELVEDKNSTISLITAKESNFTKDTSAKTKQTVVLKNPSLSIVQERFSQVSDDVVITEEGTVARHVANTGKYVHILGEQLYFQGRKVVRFRVEYEQNLYNLFFGCISSQVPNDRICFCSPDSAGWFGCNQIYHQGNMLGKGYNSSEIRTNDVLGLTFDCEKKQIELCHERTNTTNKLQINIKKAPLPWRILVVLYRTGDCIRILPNV